MADEGFRRKPAAILSAKIEVYCRLMDDEEGHLPSACDTYSLCV
jgi:hypothetical protein